MIFHDIQSFYSFSFAILIYEYMHNFYCRCFLYLSKLVHIKAVASQLVTRQQMKSMKDKRMLDKKYICHRS